jgi:hypothetical protein
MPGMTPDEIALLLTFVVAAGFLAAVTALALWIQR